MSENKPKPSNQTAEHLEYEDIAPPPSILRWFIFATLMFLILLVLGIIGGGWAFREVVPPRYQVYYSEQFPILKVLLPPRPANDAVLPTPIPQENSISLEELLGSPVQTPTLAEQTPEPVATLPPTEVATVTPIPTLTAPPLPTATSLPRVTESSALSGVQLVSSAPSKARNHGFTYTKQTWNNCGPANVTMSLSYFGWLEDQSYAQNYLRGNREDKNVSPQEIEAFVNNQTGVNATYRIGGSVNLLKQLIAGGFPIMIELGYAPEGNDWLGHYQTLVGYDDSIGSFYVMDTYIPSPDGLAVPYLELDRNWQAFNRTLIVYFTDEQETTVTTLLGDLATVEGGYLKALETAQREARENPQNGFAWFNLGTANSLLGNFPAAAAAFDQARQLNLPWRMLWYQFEPFRAYYETERISDLTALINSNLQTLGNGFVEETHYWQGKAYEAQGDTLQAQNAYRQAIQQNARYQAAIDALEQVE